MSLRVEAPGLLTSVQDAGRFGLQHLGVGPAGAADRLSFTLANLLAGNPPAAAALEFTLRRRCLRSSGGSISCSSSGRFIQRAHERARKRLHANVLAGS